MHKGAGINEEGLLVGLWGLRGKVRVAEVGQGRARAKLALASVAEQTSNGEGWRVVVCWTDGGRHALLCRNKVKRVSDSALGLRKEAAIQYGGE